ncbi:16S rRNA (uracil(1498)-N(3))-methyltransferase [Halodesulfovibrio spirochaetisodalis]|uniref:Ribosomal RNA small subunit methyltransferase E n=1 Tax=Halodesulfovibrio spirochaetisodalis TaxID=1560234 RepID=A0A1B7XJG1_9BACT|nr:16S rRNA (uracil(1498)-N(3))-methyltransferase [Halodesulfovibrio spirochaetisodalis]OBQ55667.1 16S rRNA methyltransferase [Halodesulfovibrio spirochaetisodalis]
MKTFFLEADKWDEHCVLEGQEAKHAIKVLRMRSGDSIRLLDGKGREGTFTITETTKHTVTLQQQEVVQHPKPENQYYVAIGWGKSVRRGWILEKAVEFGATGLWFWQADRSQSKVPAEAKEGWEGQMLAGAKQCNNPWVPEIATFTDGAKGVMQAAQEFDNIFMLWEGQSPSEVLSTEQLNLSGKTLFVVGPEGGFSESEATYFMEQGAKPVSLGKRILRWETAALLCLGLAWWNGEVNNAAR